MGPMSCLAFKKDGREVFRYPLNGSTIHIGRGGHNHVVLSDVEISRSHLTLESQDGVLTALSLSSQGATKNGKSFDSTAFKLDDEIVIGPWHILLCDSGVEDQKTHVASEEKTQILDYDTQEKALKVSEVEVTVHFPEGQSRSYQFKHFPINIGSGTQNTLILKDPFISEAHCQIDVKAGQLWMSDADSKNGTWVSGKKVTEGFLSNGDEITLGKVRLGICLGQVAEKIQPAQESVFEGMIGESLKMREIFSLIDKVAPSDMPIFISGETGTGKELAARAIHRRSLRAHQPFLAINCGAISPNLIESELFGHEKGAFTGAVSSRHGVFEAAHGGTLFLDEIGELPIDLQPKLLRVLEEGTIKRVGANQELSVDVRIVAATHRQLRAEVKLGNFREDLFYRLYVIPMTLPPLRHRLDDLPALVTGILSTHAPTGKKFSLSESALESLRQHSWSGNIRELKNILLRTIYLASGSLIEAKDLQFLKDIALDEAATDAAGGDSTKTLADGEKHIILQTLKECQGNKKKTAEVLGIAKSTLFKKLKDYGIL
jgi:transcriptional regulator with AAA-type ATPase domain/pSer/pThr/pTyr-binding forkhead associated (FHA) protein